jgi:tetratricopeptide (TPR) repeat protein
MADKADVDALRRKAKTTLGQLRGGAAGGALDEAKALVEDLRNVRAYEMMGQLAEAVSRHDPEDPKNRRLYGQYLAEAGKASVAIDVLRPLTEQLPADHPEAAEAWGLLGRAHKQIFIEAPDKTAPVALNALENAIASYRKPFEDDPKNTWHAVNLVALLSRARRFGSQVAPDLDVAKIARSAIAELEATPKDKRDDWFFATLAEAALGLGDWDKVEANVKAFSAADDSKAFVVASALRQFAEVWDIGATGRRGRGLLAILQARLLQLPGGDLELRADDINDLQRVQPDRGQLEAVLGDNGAQTIRWYKTGLDRARSVAAIRQKLADRIGTGFLVRAGDFGLAPENELLVLTNFHVVNKEGAHPGLRPEMAEVVFEAADPAKSYSVKEIAWTSPIEKHDASFLRLAEPVQGVAPMPLASALPIVEEGTLVYVIGHPGGRELAISLQDNELLDHEGPPNGVPQIEGVCRVHYRAPTDHGSSGSPVFNSSLWEVIALHHSGGKTAIPKLNGKQGAYGANEGISIQSIKKVVTG